LYYEAKRGAKIVLFKFTKGVESAGYLPVAYRSATKY